MSSYSIRTPLAPSRDRSGKSCGTAGWAQPAGTPGCGCQRGQPGPALSHLAGPQRLHLLQVGDLGRSSLEVEVHQPHLGGTAVLGALLPRALPRGRYLCHGELQSLAPGAGALAGVTRVPPEAAVLGDVPVQLQGQAAGSRAGLGARRHQLPLAPTPRVGTAQELPADPRRVPDPAGLPQPVSQSRSHLTCRGGGI